VETSEACTRILMKFCCSNEGAWGPVDVDQSRARPRCSVQKDV
jgi:hypothetical protein